MNRQHQGKYSFGRINIIGSGGDVIIGKFCSIAGNVSVINVGHNVDWISTYPFTAKSMNLRGPWMNCPGGIESIEGHPTLLGDLIIGNDVWIGQNVIFIGGIKIGDGSVIGANSLVAKDVEPYSIMGGNPCKLIRKRFSDDIIEKLLQIQWWNWNEEKIKNNIPLLCSKNIQKFIKKNM